MQRSTSLLVRLPGMTTRSIRTSLMNTSTTTSRMNIVGKNVLTTTNSLKCAIITWPPVLPSACLSTSGTAEGSTTNNATRAGASSVTELLDGDEEETTKFIKGQSYEGKEIPDSKMKNQDNTSKNNKSNKKTMMNNKSTTNNNLDQSMTVSTSGDHHETGHSNNNSSSFSSSSNSSSTSPSSSTSNSNKGNRTNNNNNNRSSNTSSNPKQSQQRFQNNRDNNKGNRFNNTNPSSSSNFSRNNPSSNTDVRKETMASLLDKTGNEIIDELHANYNEPLSFDSGSTTGIESSSSSPAYQQYVHNILNDKPYTGPIMDAIVTNTGKTLPLNNDDMNTILQRQLQNKRTPLGGKRTVKNVRADAIENVLVKRGLRSVYSDMELDEFVNAVEMQYGRKYFDTQGLGTYNGLTGTGLSDTNNYLLTRRNNDYQIGNDPILDTKQTKLPFDIRAITLTSNLTFNAIPNTSSIDNKVVLTVKVKSLGLPLLNQQYLKLLAGPRYHPRTDILRMSLDMYNDSASNKRLLLERMIQLVNTANSMVKEYGSKGITTPRRYARYSHYG